MLAFNMMTTSAEFSRPDLDLRHGGLAERFKLLRVRPEFPMATNFDTAISHVEYFDTKTRNALQNGGFATLGRLLTHYPFRYEDRRSFDHFPQEESEAPLCLHGEVVDVQYRKMGFKRGYVEIKIAAVGAPAWSLPISLRFFNMPYIIKNFAVEQQLVVYGKVKRSGQKLVMDHPDHEIVAEDSAEALIHLKRIVPVYRDREGVPQRMMRRAIFEALAHLSPDSVKDILRKPSEKGEFAGLTRFWAIQQIHFPESMEHLDRARRYLALEEFFVLQLNVLRRRRDWNELSGPPRQPAVGLLERWKATLPFSLTSAQERAIAEIRQDLEQPRPMNRLLQGDVGSGKTFVAMAAMLMAVDSGTQAALMAPTQILAEQHYLNFRKWLEPLGVRVALRTSSRQEDGYLELWSGGDAPQMLIGTHALIAGGVSFENLGLVVIDEQHKFGVDQRSRLIRQGSAPDVLAMSATPIPRTLTMTVYGDLDVSIIDEMPAGRGQILTAVREQPDLAQVTAFLRQQVEQGRQAYLVYPLVEESDALKVKAATAEFEAWRKRLAPISCGLLHGRLSSDEKEAVMREFRDNSTQVLVATTVIEVGVDVPNATVMIVFEAERFGLAQLHQLRGRIGRGSHKSWCILVASGKNPEGTERLRILESTTDGFAVAEEDLKLRGPGDLLGTAQSGLPGLQLGDLIRDEKLVKVARMLAQEVLTRDPEFQLPEHLHLRRLLLKEDQIATLS